MEFSVEIHQTLHSIIQCRVSTHEHNAIIAHIKRNGGKHPLFLDIYT